MILAWGVQWPVYSLTISGGAIISMLAVSFLPGSLYVGGLAVEVLLPSTFLAGAGHIPLWFQIFVAVVGFSF